MLSFCELLQKSDRKQSDWKDHKLAQDVHSPRQEVLQRVIKIAQKIIGTHHRTSLILVRLGAYPP